MFMTRIFCTLFCLAPSWGHAQSVLAPEQLPPALVTFTETLSERCSPESQAQIPRASFQRPYDFNRDGVKDYLISSRDFRCMPDGNLIFGGTAGTHYWVFISQSDGGFEEALHTAGHFMERVFFTKQQSAPALVFYHHGTACGLAGASACVGAVIWDGYAKRFVGTGL